MFRSVVKPVKSSLDKPRQYAGKAEAAPKFHGWHTISVPYAYYAADAVI